MTRSRFVSDWEMAVECPTWAARYRVLVENWVWMCLAWVRHNGLPRGRTALNGSSIIAIAIACWNDQSGLTQSHQLQDVERLECCY